MTSQSECQRCFETYVVIFTNATPLALDGIADFDIALAKHCNLVSCSFVLQID